MKQSRNTSELRQSVTLLLPYLKSVLLFSFFTSLLVLAPSGYMLEVYDRVVNSRNETTLLMLTVLVVALYVLLELIEWVRRQVMQKAALQLDNEVRGKIFHAMFAARLLNFSGAGVQPLRDLKTIRDFLPSSPFLAFIDTPFAFLVVILLFLMSPLLGWFAMGGAILQVMLGLVNRQRVREPLADASRSSIAAQNYAQAATRNAQVVQSMGMLGAVHSRWVRLQEEFLARQAEASDYAGSNAALSKMLQSLVSSLLLGLGCYLALQGELSGGLMIVGSILGGRVLAPIVQLITGWRQIETALEAYKRLDVLLRDFPVPEKGMPLPPPSGRLVVEGVVGGPPNSGIQVLKGVAFKLEPGNSLAVVGPSGSGKTTLARLLVGIWPAMSGKVRLDGQDVYTWDKDELGKSIGYLPQDVELFEGTLAENIARFDEVDMDRVREACRLAGVDGVIEAFPDGYETEVGADGSFLSGGERQRVALARAVYGDPSFVVLDEPNASLDQEGDAALVGMLKMLRERGTTVVVITHRPSLLSAVEQMMVLIEGRIQKFGPCAEVMAELRPEPAAKPAPPSAVKPKPPPGPSAVVSIPSMGGRL